MRIHIRADVCKVYWSEINARGLRYCPTNEEHKFGDMLRAIADTWVEVDTQYLFSNQYNTVPIAGVSESGLRLHDRHIDEIEGDTRDNVGCCGFCGNQTTGTITGICKACLDSEYLDEKTLLSGLTRIQPVSSNEKRQPLTAEESADILPRYVLRQTIGDDSRNANKLRKMRQRLHDDCEKTIHHATIERDGFLWLMDQNINTENCIYYSHTNTFCFGWRNKLSESVKAELCEKLAGFPFNHEFK